MLTAREPRSVCFRKFAVSCIPSAVFMKRQKSAPAATGTRTHGSGVPFPVEAGEHKEDF